MNTPRRNEALRLLLFVALAAAAARFAWEALRSLDVFADYHAYYRAAVNLRAGADIYAEGRLLVARNSFDFWTQTDGQYVYPPALAVTLIPLTILDIGKGSPVWLLALVLAALACPWIAAYLLGRPAGVNAFLLVALPTWALLPLALGVRHGLVAPLPVALTVVALAAYLVAARGALRLWSPAAPGSARASPGDRSWRSRIAPVVGRLAPDVLPLALPLLALLALAAGWRAGQIDGFLLKLAAPGLVGTTALPWLHRLSSGRAAARADGAALLPLAIATLGATPLLIGLRFGQPDIVLLLLTMLALLAHLRRRDLLAGIALGAAAAVKPTIALLGLYYLRQRAWATLCAAALTGAVVGFGPFFFLGRAAFADWFAISRYFTGDDYAAYPSNQSLRGLLLRAFVGGPRHAPLVLSPLLADLLWFLAIAAALLLWWRVVPAARDEAALVVAGYSLTVALVLLLAPLSEDIHYVALILPLAFLADRLVRASRARLWRALAALALLAFVLPLPALAERVAGGPALRLLASSPYLYGLLLVVAALVAWIASERRPPVAA